MRLSQFGKYSSNAKPKLPHQPTFGKQENTPSASYKKTQTVHSSKVFSKESSPGSVSFKALACPTQDIKTIDFLNKESGHRNTRVIFHSRQSSITHYQQDNSMSSHHYDLSQQKESPPACCKNRRRSPGHEPYGSQSPYSKLGIVGLRKQLDKFIYEEKEKTLMNKSDIPDPDALDIDLHEIAEKQNVQFSDLSRGKVRFLSPQHQRFNRNKNMVTNCQPYQSYDAQKERMEGQSPVDSRNNDGPFRISHFSEEDEELIQIVNKYIQTAKRKTDFMAQTQSFMRNYEVKSPPRFQRKKEGIRSITHAPKICLSEKYSSPPEESMLNTPIAPLQNTTDFTIAKNANQASMIDKTEPTVNKGVLKQMPNYFSLKDIQHQVPSYVKSSNNRKLKTQFRNALKQFQSAKDKMCASTFNIFRNQRKPSSEDIETGVAFMHFLSLTDQSIPLTSDKAHLLDPSWDFVKNYLRTANMRVVMVNIRDELDNNLLNKKLIQRIKKLVKFNPTLLTAQGQLLHNFIQTGLDYIQLRQAVQLQRK